jgi:DNA-binding winged helix-turn-helix (wHTH) protein
VRRVAEFWADHPDAEAIANSGLNGHPFLEVKLPQVESQSLIDSAQLTAKEHLLLIYLQAHAGQVCEKDDLIHAVWPEDVIFEQGIRDESLAQLVRRLRVKVEPDPANPTYIHTIPGRGYLFRGK